MKLIELNKFGNDLADDDAELKPISASVDLLDEILEKIKNVG